MGIDTHELNRVMAEVCGIELEERLNANGEPYWVHWYDMGHGQSLQVWSPCAAEANQMMLVKAKLKKMGVEYVIATINLLCDMLVEVIDKNGTYSARDGSELIAFGQAVSDWWQERVK